MDKQVILGIVRHVLTTSGGVLITKGLTDSAGVEAIVGGLITVAGIVWSCIQKRRAATPSK